VPDEFLPAMHRVSDIEAMAGVSFNQAIIEADQFDAARGVEMAFRTGADRA